MLTTYRSVSINQEPHGMTNHPPTINNNQPKVINSGEKHDYSAVPHVLQVKSIYSVMEIKNQESRIKLQFSQIMHIVSVFLHNYVQLINGLCKMPRNSWQLTDVSETLKIIYCICIHLIIWRDPVSVSRQSQQLLINAFLKTISILSWRLSFSQWLNVTPINLQFQKE